MISSKLGSVFLLAAVLVSLGSKQTYARWQWTEWGMTKEVVQASSPIELYDDSDISDEYADELYGDYQAQTGEFGTVNFLANFNFQENKLVEVVLRASNSWSCLGVPEALLQTYGRGVRQQYSDRTTWDLPDRDLAISLRFEAGKICEIRYSPPAAPPPAVSGF